MKYPQLVSTRAVNAISDWLVSRLEQLGVEAPLIYSRLLLSLLHSSVQINDPIEFNNLETYLTNRRGQKRHHHHYPPTDANTLKKLTAIQCLTEAISSDQEISNIETLVDELCEKLNDIEKQIDSDDKEYQTIGQILNFITVVGSTSDTEPGTSVSTSSLSKATGADSTSSTAFSVAENTRNYNIRNKNINNLNILTKQRNNKSNKARVIIDLKDIEDPRKRYYNAFPALTKEMEDSFRNSNRYTKALTWPNDKTTSFIQNHINNNNNNNNNINKEIANPVNNNLNSVNINNQNEMYIRSNSNNLNNINTAGVKRKPKRRRNQAMSKGRTSNNHQRKNSYSGNCSPTWDTDFEGSWEMGRDLYKEFIMKENNRNRSTSESAAYNEGITSSNTNNSAKKKNTIDEYNKCEKYPNLIDKNVEGNVFFGFTFCDQNKNLFASNLIKNKDSTGRNLVGPRFQCSISSEIMEDEISSTTVLPNTTILDSNNLQINNIDHNNLLSDEGYSTHENLTSLSELDTSGVEAADVNKNEGMEQNHYLYPAQHNLYQNMDNNDDSSMSLCSNIEQQQYDFAQFKAKFNSSVEALWKRNINDQNENSNFSTNSDELRSLPLVQQRQGLNNFWINYNNHRYDTNKIEHFIDEEKNFENIEQRDFLSMPSGIKVTAGSKEASSVFLQNSIWSDSVKNYDNDESFFSYGKKSLQPKDLKENENNPYEHYYQNYPHEITKCQEGINEISIEENSLCSNNFQQQNSFSDLNPEMREIMLNNSNFYNYLPQPQSSQQGEGVNFVKSCSHDYNEEIAAFSKQAKQQFQNINLNKNNDFQQSAYRKNQIQVKQQSPPVSLENHSKTTSAFVEYSSIKKQSSDNFSQSNYAKEYLDNSNYAPTYGEDENLLTSDRTHFRPIKQTYADGYVFDICNYLDEIEYERSESGFLCYDGEKYLEFIKTDGGSSYYENKQNSLSEKTSNAQVSNDYCKTVRSKYDEFVLKFRVNNKNEKDCQTDPPPISPQEMNFRTYIDLQLMNSARLNQNFHHNYFNQFMSESESEIASNYYYFEDENRSSTSTDEYEKFDGSFIYNTPSNKNCSNIESAKAAAAVIIAAVANNNNQFDSNKKLQEWSTFDVRKKCNANTNLNKYNGNNNENHTLWGTCPACNANQELESTPANRLLKDELRIEGDEIMSDLKYMQDLYIGSDWEEGTCSSSGSDSDNFASDIIETDYEIDKNSENNLELNMGNKKMIKKTDYYCKEENENNNIEEYSLKDDSQQTDIYYNVTKLIADLLKPENAKSLANALGEAAIQAANVQAKISSNNYNMEVRKPSQRDILQEQDTSGVDGFCGGLWASDEHIIWKKELKPIDNYLTQFNINNNNNDLIQTNTVSGKLDWEYSNLADIWKQEMQFDSTKNYFKDNEIHDEKENVDIKENNSNFSKNFFEFDKNNQENLFNTISNQNTERASNISQYNKLLKESISGKNENKAQSTTNEEPSNVNKNSNPYFGINKKNNRFDRKRRHSASQMVTSSCNKDVLVSIPTEETNDNSIISSSNNNHNNQIRPENASKFIDKNLSNTTINNIFGKGKENLKFEISNNCRNFLNNCQNIIGGGDLIKDKNNFNFCENFIIGENKIELMTTAAKDLLIKTNLNDYVVGIHNDDDDDDDDDDNENDDSKVTSTTSLIEKTPSSNTSGARIISCNYVTFTKDFNSNNSAFWPKGNSYLEYEYDKIGGISTSINPSSILKHVALVSRPLTR